jgi:hypothetical protein
MNLKKRHLPYIKYVTSDPSVTTQINSTVQQVEKNETYTQMNYVEGKFHA